MLTQEQIDDLSAEDYSLFLSNEEEFCEGLQTIADLWAHDLYTKAHLGCLGDIDNTSHGDASWIVSLVSTMSQDMTSGLHDEHCMSTAVF